jgi:hypothetical protein
VVADGETVKLCNSPRKCDHRTSVAICLSPTFLFLSLSCNAPMEHTSQVSEGVWGDLDGGVWRFPHFPRCLDDAASSTVCDTYPFTVNDDGGLSEPVNSALTCTVTPTCWSGANFGWCAYSQPCDGGDLWTCNLATPDPDLCVFATQLDDTSAQWCCQ